MNRFNIRKEIVKTMVEELKRGLDEKLSDIYWWEVGKYDEDGKGFTQYFAINEGRSTKEAWIKYQGGK
jgi:hypothetical protein